MKKIITFGTFDVFHLGHLRILERSRKFGDYLVVGVSTDEMSIDKKGRPPIYSFSERCSILMALEVVDEVFPEESLEQKREYIEENSANVLVMGDDWKGKFDHLQDICSVIYLPRTPAISTTAIIEKIRD